jgi:hypothetical protein
MIHALVVEMGNEFSELVIKFAKKLVDSTPYNDPRWNADSSQNERMF